METPPIPEISFDHLLHDKLMILANYVGIPEQLQEIIGLLEARMEELEQTP